MYYVVHSTYEKIRDTKGSESHLYDALEPAIQKKADEIRKSESHLYDVLEPVMQRQDKNDTRSRVNMLYVAVDLVTQKEDKDDIIKSSENSLYEKLESAAHNEGIANNISEQVNEGLYDQLSPPSDRSNDSSYSNKITSKPRKPD